MIFLPERYRFFCDSRGLATSNFCAKMEGELKIIFKKILES